MKMKCRKSESGVDNSRLSFLVGYLYNEADMKRLFRLTHSYNFAGINIQQKNIYLKRLSAEKHNSFRTGNVSDFYSSIGIRPFTVLFHFLDNSMLRFTDRIQRVFVPRFYHDRKDTNFLKGLIYVGEKNRN